MENVRKYCEYIDLYFQVEPNIEKQDNYVFERTKCLDAVSNKLLSMDDTNKKYYAQMIADYFENNASLYFDLLHAFLPDDDKITKDDVRKEIEDAGETATEEEITLVWERAKQKRTISDDATLCVAELIWNIAKLFSCCDIDVNKFFRVYTIPVESPTFTEPVDSTIETKELIKRNGVIMNWKGQNNVLTDMFRQAKNKGYLINSIPDIALFLKENFSCFANTKLSTIETQLKNNSSSANAFPKEEKRIKIGN
ncbi:MAG: hypothetical protein ACLRPS_02680 [Paraprevotella clara]|jgi:hypothetical protein|uniref:Uncharacterized protein n=1 Tax=Paraprevotella clara TaxID=454154 RepID=A0A6N3FCW5_9BACT